MQIDIDSYIDGILDGNRLMLARTITLIESILPVHQEAARTIIDKILPKTGNSVRLGITGVPGAGKSTFIESFGTMLTAMGHKVAVLAIDPSSTRSGGSILGDKTRMEKLSVDPNAFIRPSPSGGNLGGVARKTREAMLACEAAGFDVIIVETVGVGQSETTVASMVDFFMVLMIAGAGDELQGIKKGVLEVADAIVINKSDGDNIVRAEAAQKEYQAALHLLMPRSPHWNPPVLTCSSLRAIGLDNIWDTVQEHRTKLTDCGELAEIRKSQSLDWMSFLLNEGLSEWFYHLDQVKNLLPKMRQMVEAEKISPTAAANELLKLITSKDNA
ncbi:methylmalonyl Co-A mutase-associated GTPase MeaB [Desulfosediminicola flagellatus]|uniref:methylmalonyl Co-A mutase-associated GTPase MeaB n=1 Tax=Desulfosediminicola flagellatus TaxID=2569541 RepID=UPI0010ADA4DB|nr:methylmalonyl Co-A mutase-associated GTPase MeaB [Desulfosediminicola flagellatus]